MTSILEFFGNIANWILAFVALFGSYFFARYLAEKITDKLSYKFSGFPQILISFVLAFIFSITLFFLYYSSQYSIQKHVSHLHIIDISPSIQQGDEVHLVIKGKPDTIYDIDIDCKLKDAPSTEKTNLDGIAVFSWKIDYAVPDGEYELFVSELESDNDELESISFTVE